MRICVVSLTCRVHGIGGVQDHTTDLACGLARLGHEVEVISAAHPEGLREEVWEGVRWRFVDAPPTWFGDRRWLAASCEEFRRARARTPFDVVHGQGSGALGLVLGGAVRETPLVEMFHGNYLGLVKASLRRARAARGPRATLREPRHLVTLSRRHFAHGNWRRFRDCEAIVPSRQQLVDTCRSHRLDPERVHVVPNGVDTALFRPQPQAAVRARLGLGEGFAFVFAGRLNRQKGAHHAIEALAEARAGGVAARLLVVGDGEERDWLESLARRRRLDDVVAFVGAQPRVTVADYLAAADAFVFPTERDEAAPLVLLQALACGLPVVATVRGGIPEVVDRPGDNGLLVPPGDRGALVNAMRHLYEDEALRERLARSALARVRAEYALERMVERTVAVYELAVATAGARSEPDPLGVEASRLAPWLGAASLPALPGHVLRHGVGLLPYAAHAARLVVRLHI